jgi:uroporphyrin-3 C-methyltransferase
VNSPEVLLLSNRQETDLRNTLRLSLLNARISLLSRQASLLKSDLERSSNLLDTYFDTKALQVQRAQTILAEIKEVQLDLVLPELQSTTAALRLAVAGQQGERQ